jgi:phenylalanyl-tRNA synthetase beta chain
MKLSLNWLSELVDLPGDTGRLCSLLTLSGIEVEGREERGIRSDKIVVATIVGAERHPNADRLTVCKVDDGSGTPRQIVCGAKNFKVGDRVPLAQPGAVLPGDFKIKVGKLRGVESEGMLCSGAELGIPDEADGLLILSPEVPVGDRLDALIPPDTILEIEVTPNRPDLLSYIGVAREIAALTGAEPRDPTAGLPGADAGDGGVTVRLDADDLCPYYTARRIEGVKIGPSPAWLAAKLAAAGIRPINNVVDVTNFVLLETGQPLHAFDAAKLTGEIRVRKGMPGETFLALDGKSYRLSENDLIIADEAKAVAVGGVMGGEATGVTGSTVDLVLESAWFLPAAVRRTSRALGLASDSSYRFERRVDPDGVRRASERAVALIVQVAGGRPSGRVTVAGEPPAGPGRVGLRNGRCRSVIGAEIGDDEIADILRRLGLRDSDGAWIVPSFRADLGREIDLIEEVARVIGMERVPSRLAGLFVSASEPDKAHDDAMRIRRALAGAGFSEARTLTMVRSGTEVVSGGVPVEGVIRIKNPLGEDHACLRTSLIPNLIESVSRNVRAGAGAVKLFEIGRVFLAPGDERVHLGLIATGAVAEASWRDAAPRAFDIHDLAGVLGGMGIESVEVGAGEVPGFALGARVLLGGEDRGWMGVLPQAVARGHDFSAPVLVGEIDLVGVRLPEPSARAFREVERYPAVVRDVAFVVSAGVTHAAVIAAIRSANERLLADVALFDVFADPTGEKIAPDKKSLAYTLTYRSMGRTLTSEEVAEAHGRVKLALTERLGATLRE